MNLQKNVLQKYLELYPSYPLRKIADQTGIQQTRVFRILNGQEMKLSEYEKFREVISIASNSTNFEKSYNILKDLKKLTYSQIEKITDDINYFICNNSIQNQKNSHFQFEMKA